jgi:hypothetical protein
MAYKTSTRKGVPVKRKVSSKQKNDDKGSFPRLSALAEKKVKEQLKRYKTAKKEDTVANAAMEVQYILRKYNNRSIKLTKPEARLVHEINYIMRIRCITRWAALLKRRADKNFHKMC